MSDQPRFGIGGVDPEFVKNFDPDQERDENGKWASGGGSGASSDGKQIKMSEKRHQHLEAGSNDQVATSSKTRMKEAVRELTNDLRSAGFVQGASIGKDRGSGMYTQSVVETSWESSQAKVLVSELRDPRPGRVIYGLSYTYSKK